VVANPESSNHLASDRLKFNNEFLDRKVFCRSWDGL